MLIDLDLLKVKLINCNVIQKLKNNKSSGGDGLMGIVEICWLRYGLHVGTVFTVVWHEKVVPKECT